jgi:hypothetical protein
MKKALLVLVLLASPVSAQVLQPPKVCDVPSPGVKTISCSLASTTTAGSMIRVVEIDRTAAGTRTAKSSKGTVLTGVTSLKNAGSVSIFYGPSDGSLSYTVTASTGVYNPVMWVQEDTFGGAVDGLPVAAGGALNTTPQAISAGSLTTTATGDYLINGCENNFGSGGLTAGTGWNAFHVAPDVPGGFEDRSVAAIGAYQANGTLVKAQYTWNCSAVAFKGGSGPPPPPPNTCSGTGTLQVNGSGTPLSMASTFTMPGATVGVAYSASIATAASVTGGTPPYTYAITSGSLPAKLTMSTAGLVTGTPSTTGTSSFVVTVTDSSGSAIQMNMGLVTGQ